MADRESMSWGTRSEQVEAELFFGDLLDLPRARRRRAPSGFAEATGGPTVFIGRPTPTSTTSTAAKGYPPFYRMPQAYGHYFGRGPTAPAVWGQFILIYYLATLSNRWAIAERDHPFGLGDLGNEDGSDVHSHESHGSGLAADIYLINTDGAYRRVQRGGSASNMTHIGMLPGSGQCSINRSLPASDPRRQRCYDRPRNTKLLEMMVDLAIDSNRPGRPGWLFHNILFNDRDVRNQINQYAERKATAVYGRLGQPVPDVYRIDPANHLPGLVRHHDNHDEHIHIRFVPGQPVFSQQRIDELLRTAYQL